MSALDAVLPASQLGERLRSTAAVEPGKLPGLLRIAGAIAEDAAKLLRAASVVPLGVTLEGVERVMAPAAGEESLFPENGLFCALSGARLEGIGFLAAEPDFVDAVVCAFFGGGRSAKGAPHRAPTALDRSLAERAFSMLAMSVSASLQPLGVGPVEPSPLRTADAVVREIGDEAGGFVVLRLAVKVGGTRDALAIALPERAFAAHRRALSVVPVEAQAPDPDWMRDMETGVSRSTMGVRVVLSTQDLALSRVASFAVGQTIELAATLESLVDVEIEGQRLFRGQVGRARDHYVVRVDSQIDPAQEFLDDILSD